MKYIFFLSLLWCISANPAAAQSHLTKPSAANRWADSIYNSLSPDQRIAQLMILRLSAYDYDKKTPIYYESEVADAIEKYNVGGICLFQGHPEKLANIINALQHKAQTPLMTCIDAEWGVGMRLFDSVAALPHQMMLGAMQDASIVYDYGQLVGAQCKRLGINVNYAPVVDINNNPNNPVINDRSFGEDKYKVALYGTQYMKGMQDAGVMACAKHFPGHGDVAVDSHLDLPVINKSMAQLDSLELYPFKAIFKAGVGSVMVAHLYIPAIDSTPNRATSISAKNIKTLMRDTLGYQGLTFTDALEMQGVKKFFPDGAASVQSLIAGNDMLCLPGDVALSIKKIKAAINANQLSWLDIEAHCKRVLLAKFAFGMAHFDPIRTGGITKDLNNGVAEMKKLVAQNALTLLQPSAEAFYPIAKDEASPLSEIAYVGIGISDDNAFSKALRKQFNAATFFFNYTEDRTRISSTIDLIKSRYKKVIIGIHQYSRTPANNFGLSAAAIELATQLQQQTNSMSFVFGNPYAIKNFSAAKNILACYEDDTCTQQAAIALLQGDIDARGKLPVTVCATLPFGSGTVVAVENDPYCATATAQGMNVAQLKRIDSIAKDAIAAKATPGCVVWVTKNGKVVYNKAFGHFNYDKKERVTPSAVYDLASVTKVAATTLAVMKLYEEGKIKLDKKLGNYLPWLKGSNKAGITLANCLLHQSGLVHYIPFYKETIDSSGLPLTRYYRHQPSDSFNVRVAEGLFLRKDWKDTMLLRIAQSPLQTPGKYVYSDNNFILLAKVVEAVSGMPLDEYVTNNFYRPLGLSSIGFHPAAAIAATRLAPSELEPQFRQQLLRGDVHDPGAAMFGGVSGHAGLYSDAADLGALIQMLIDGGQFNGKPLLQKKTIDLFTAYNSRSSRRGLGFDKPEKDNPLRAEPYPCAGAPSSIFGHTGFTGTCVWADPANQLVYVFLSNRLTPQGANNNKLVKMNVRTKIQEAIYQSLNNDTHK